MAFDFTHTGFPGLERKKGQHISGDTAVALMPADLVTADPAGRVPFCIKKQSRERGGAFDINYAR